MLVPSINTLGFPDWTFSQVVSFAQEHHIPYIELRTLQNTEDLLILPEFSNEAGIRSSANLLRASGVELLALNLGFRLTDDLNPQSTSIRRYAALAGELGARYLRFFPGGNPDIHPDLDRIAEGMGLVNHLLADFPVQIIVETHDSLVHSEDILNLDQRMNGHLNLLWDIAHTQNYGGEPWQETYQKLNPLIHYLHVKDTHKESGHIQNVALDAGNLDVLNLLRFLQQKLEPIIVSFEWERRWDPSLAPGEIAALDFLDKIEAISRDK